MFTTRDSCRGCGGKLDLILDLGEITPSDFLLPDEPDPDPIPLTLLSCRACGLVQLGQTVDDEQLYRRYWYISGTNEVMRAELADVVKSAKALVSCVIGDCVVDVGANDGTLLTNYSSFVHRIAFEPAGNLIERLGQVADVAYNEFFPGRASKRLPDLSVKILSSIAMFYDLEDPRSFVREVDRLLTDDGVWVVQFQDLAQQVQTNAVDNLCFEHRLYLSLASLTGLLSGCDLCVVKVERRAINGGSLRCFIRRRGEMVDPSVLEWAHQEAPWITHLALERFAWQAGVTRTMLRSLLEGAIERVGLLDLYAASTKSSTLVQYCGLAGWIGRAVERTPEKVGRRTSGTNIPIISEETWREDPGQLAILGAWQFAEAFCLREQDYLKRGGGFVVPLPSPRIIYYGGGR